MYKNHIVKYLTFFIFTAIVLLSCDGRHRNLKTNLEAFKSSMGIADYGSRTLYIPEKPVKIITDTILSNGFRVKTDYYSLKKLHRIKDFEGKTTIYYNDFEARIKMWSNKGISKEIILNKGLFKGFGTSEYLESAVMQYVWIDYESSTNSKIELNTTFKSLKNNHYIDFVVVIDIFGTVDIKKKDLHTKHI
ncbi:hypothetical protein [Cognatitamlana onchidii]|uniref:hypothetical protein n=1 Tax=Cognatitamlana onchidii TaxID=2562860 RepID=UPI0010A605C7|nr:hypothetical protein [Algibacter onchidii]